MAELPSFRVDEIDVPFGSSGVQQDGVLRVVPQTHDAVAAMTIGSELSDQFPCLGVVHLEGKKNTKTNLHCLRRVNRFS